MKLTYIHLLIFFVTKNSNTNDNTIANGKIKGLIGWLQIKNNEARQSAKNGIANNPMPMAKAPPSVCVLKALTKEKLDIMTLYINNAEFSFGITYNYGLFF